MERDIEVYETHQIPNNEENLANIVRFLELNKSPNSSIDSVSYYFGRSLDYNNWRLTTTTFETVKYSGKLALLSNFTLKRNLTRLHGSAAGQVNHIMEAGFAIRDEISDYLTKNSSVYFQEENADLTFLKDKEFKNLMHRWKIATEWKITEYKKITKECKIVLEEIDKEIKKLE